VLDVPEHYSESLAINSLLIKHTLTIPAFKNFSNFYQKLFNFKCSIGFSNLLSYFDLIFYITHIYFISGMSTSSSPASSQATEPTKPLDGEGTIKRSKQPSPRQHSKQALPVNNSSQEQKLDFIAALTTAWIVREASVADALLECKDNMCNTSYSVVKLKFVSLPLDYTLIPKKDKLHFEDILVQDLNDHNKVTRSLRLHVNICELGIHDFPTPC